jgi:hypothetical protein
MDIKLDVNKALQEIANGLGVAVDKLYPILYKQAQIDGAVNLIWISVIIIYIVYYCKLAKFLIKNVGEKIRKSNYDGWFDYLPESTIIGLGGILAIIFGISALDLARDSITAFFNTEYYIIDHIVDKLLK